MLIPRLRLQEPGAPQVSALSLLPDLVPACAAFTGMGIKTSLRFMGIFLRTFAGRNEWASLQRNVRSQKILKQRALNQKDPAPAFCRCNDSKDGIWTVPWAAAPIAQAVEPIAWAAAPLAWAAEPTAWAAEPLHGLQNLCMGCSTLCMGFCRGARLREDMAQSVTHLPGWSGYLCLQYASSDAYTFSRNASTSAGLERPFESERQ